jgi:hypothetical protein
MSDRMVYPRGILFRFAAVATMAGSVCLALSCGAKPTASGFTDDPDGGQADGGGPESGNPGSGFGDASADAPPPVSGGTILYGHTNSALYSVDSTDPKLTVTKVGDFDCIGADAGEVPSFTDLAVDKDGKLYGVASKAVFLDMQLDGGKVGCAGKGVSLNVAANVSFYGASFAPAGTLDPAKETLVVANSDGELYAVDVMSGAATLVGNFGNVPADDGNGHAYAAAHVGKLWELSGDIVFVENGGKPLGFATLRDCPTPPMTTGCNLTDTLVEIDVSKLSATAPTNVTKSVRGQVVKAAGCADTANTSYGSMFGIAAFSGDIIGFSRIKKGGGPEESLIVRVDNNLGTACLVGDDTATAPGGWAGAGVTTKVAVTAPPPK